MGAYSAREAAASARGRISIQMTEQTSPHSSHQTSLPAVPHNQDFPPGMIATGPLAENRPAAQGER